MAAPSNKLCSVVSLQPGFSSLASGQKNLFLVSTAECFFKADIYIWNKLHWTVYMDRSASEIYPVGNFRCLESRYCPSLFNPASIV